MFKNCIATDSNMAKKSRSGSQKSTPRGTPQKATPKGTPRSNSKASPKTTANATSKATAKATSNGTPVGTPTKKSKPVKAVKPILAKSKDLGPVPRARILHSVEQLNKYTTTKQENAKESLLGDDVEEKDVQLIVVNNRSFTESRKNFKIKLLKIKHSIFKPWKEASVTSTKDFKVLLILKDSDIGKISVDDFVNEELNFPDVEIICGHDLKTKYKAFEKRRALVSEFSLILADDSIITTLPKLLGSKAYEKVETTPVGVRTHSDKEFSKKTTLNQFQKIYYEQLPIRLPRGTTMNVHLGSLEWFNSQELADNVEMIVKDLVAKYKIRSIFIKTTKSPVLPLYYNQDVLNELVEVTKVNETEEPQGIVEIDKIKVQLSTFDQSLMEIIDPEEWPTAFAKQIASAKRKGTDDQEPSASKKAKN